MAGEVLVSGQRETKSGRLVPEDIPIEIRADPHPFVSRGGFKLKKALSSFRVDVAGTVALDVGASTGGFTDCLLKSGANRVYAVDVGYGQLAWSLRRDPRVVVRERVNARYLGPEDVPEPVDVITVDVSFISLAKVLPALKQRLRDGGDILALVKPQFEAGPERVGRGGIVRDPAVHREVLGRVCVEAVSLGLEVLGLTHSPVKGDKGNMEFFVHLRKPLKEGAAGTPPDAVEIARVVESAHVELVEARDESP